jgi:hypothetical protein
VCPQVCLAALAKNLPRGELQQSRHKDQEDR